MMVLVVVVLLLCFVCPDALLVEQHEGRIAASCTCTSLQSFYNNTGDISGKQSLAISCLKGVCLLWCLGYKQTNMPRVGYIYVGWCVFIRVADAEHCFNLVCR
jgi:hypothetical protein